MFSTSALAFAGMSPDVYTVPQAAQVLGLSERRIRQMVANGTLPANRDANGAILLAQAAVHAERKSRRGTSGSKAGSTSGKKRAATSRASGRASAAAVDVDELASAVASAVGKTLEGQMELTRRAETHVRQELDEERAKRSAAEQRLAEAEAEAERLRQQLAEAQTQKKRGLFRRSG
jgi:excisionase family DNA binding protein